MKTTLKKNVKAGFSLVEMLVVIAVIGIIAAIAVPTIGSITSQANENKAKRNAQNLASVYSSAIAAGARLHGAAADDGGAIAELLMRGHRSDSFVIPRIPGAEHVGCGEAGKAVFSCRIGRWRNGGQPQLNYNSDLTE